MDEKMTLSKAETRTLVGLSMQRQELMRGLDEVSQAEQELIALLADRRKLPKGDYIVRQEPDGTLHLTPREEKQKEAPKKAS